MDCLIKDSRGGSGVDASKLLSRLMTEASVYSTVRNGYRSSELGVKLPYNQ